jgi:general secretion pathway protein A
MYKNFYGFRRGPFELSPDPYFLFRTAAHNEGFASVYHGVTQKKGFIVLTGEVGTGKTLLIRTLLQILADANVATAYVFNPRLSRDEFLRYILDDFGIPVRETKSEILHDLNRFLIERHRKRQTTALIIDEAQELDADILEEIRLLTNLETSTNKLMQIVLVGQPELDEKLDSPGLRQLKQRIALRCQLAPLDGEQTRTYIHHRVERAGAKSMGETLFPDETVQLVTKFSGGIPRLINNICENALIAAYSKQQMSVTPDLIREVAVDLRLTSPDVQPKAVQPDPVASMDPQQLLSMLVRLVRTEEESAKESYAGPKLRPW